MKTLQILYNIVAKTEILSFYTVFVLKSYIFCQKTLHFLYWQRYYINFVIGLVLGVSSLLQTLLSIFYFQHYIYSEADLTPLLAA